MIRLLYSGLLLGLLLVSSCDDDDSFFGTTTRGSGDLVTETRDLSTFTGIDVGNSIDVTLTQGSDISVTITVDDNIIEEVRTNVRNGVLSIDLEPGSYSNYTLDVDITLPEVDFIDLSNSATLIAGPFTGLNDLEVKLSNSADLELNGFDGLGEFRLDLGNSSDADLKGSANLLDLTVNNSSDLNAFDLSARDIRVDAGNSTELRVTVTESLTGSIGNSAELRYRGDPAEVDVEVGNSADLIRE